MKKIKCSWMFLISFIVILGACGSPSKVDEIRCIKEIHYTPRRIPLAQGNGVRYAKSIDEIIGESDWQKELNIKKLPIYENLMIRDKAGTPMNPYTDEESIRKLDEIMKIFQQENYTMKLDYNKDQFSVIYGKGESVNIDLHADGDYLVEDYRYNVNQNYQTREEYESLVNTFVDLYSDLLPKKINKIIECDRGFEDNLLCHVDISMDRDTDNEGFIIAPNKSLSLYILPETNNYNFWIIENNKKLKKEYEIKTKEEASVEMKAGNYYIAGGDFPDIDQLIIEGCILNYQLINQKYYYPFYTFYLSVPSEAANEIKSYREIYVPAVKEDYLIEFRIDGGDLY